MEIEKQRNRIGGAERWLSLAGGGAALAKGLTMKMGQTHVHRYLRPPLERIAKGEIDPSFVITHRFNLSDAPYAYEIFRHKEDECIKVVLDPADGVPAGGSHGARP